MASEAGDLEFVNRENELAFLLRCFGEGPVSPALVVLKAPTGFGKSRLTDRLRVTLGESERFFCIVDPSVRARLGVAILHDGYFLQRCAESLTGRAKGDGQPWLDFDQFLRRRGWRTASEKALLEVAGELPSVSSLYKQAFDYATRFLGLGRYSAKPLLTSDQGHAVSLCAEYVLQTVQTHPIALIIREAQHMDIFSLRRLLDAQDGHTSPDLIFEYTTETGSFQSEHHKAFLDAARRRGGISVLDVAKLNLDHLEQLLRRYVIENYELTTEAHLTWNGNLKDIEELRFRFGVGKIAAGPNDIVGVLEDLRGGLEQHLDELTALQRLVLIILQVHLEPMDEFAMSHVVAMADPGLQPTVLRNAIDDLIDIHHFVVRGGHSLALQHESIAEAVAGRVDLRHLMALAERALRDFYRKMVEGGDYRQVGMPLAIRQLFRLCARTRDVTGLLSATQSFTLEIRSAKDQAVYIDAVAAAIETEPQLFADDLDKLVSWAGTLAYDASDWRRVLRLQALRPAADIGPKAMRAFALQELGRHAEALDLAEEIRMVSSDSDHMLVADLITAISIGCQGEHDAARELLDRITNDADRRSSPLLGYAFRLYDVVDGFVDVLPKLQASIESFGRFGLIKSKAYSQLPAAMYLARLGDVSGARRMLNSAQRALAEEVRDQDILLNNRAAVELLAEDADYRTCADLLQAALQQATDDYSELTILTNLALALWQGGDLKGAVDRVQRARRILEHHDFEDRDTYWPVCFNLSQVLAATGDLDGANAMLDFPQERGRPLTVNQNYWAFRYGKTTEVDTVYQFLASRPIHPMYLSRWLIESEGLALLTPEHAL